MSKWIQPEGHRLWNELYWMVASGDTERVDALFYTGIAVNGCDILHATPLMIAMHSGDYAMVLHLLNTYENIIVEGTCTEGIDTIGWAGRRGDVNMVECVYDWILANRPDVNPSSTYEFYQHESPLDANEKDFVPGFMAYGVCIWMYDNQLSDHEIVGLVEKYEIPVTGNGIIYYAVLCMHMPLLHYFFKGDLESGLLDFAGSNWCRVLDLAGEGSHKSLDLLYSRCGHSFFTPRRSNLVAQEAIERDSVECLRVLDRHGVVIGQETMTSGCYTREFFLLYSCVNKGAVECAKFILGKGKALYCYEDDALTDTFETDYPAVWDRNKKTREVWQMVKEEREKRLRRLVA